MYIILTSVQSPHGVAMFTVWLSVSPLRLASDNIITYQFKQITKPAFKDVIQQHKTQMYHILYDRTLNFDMPHDRPHEP